MLKSFLIVAFLASVAESTTDKCNGVPNAVPTECGSYNFCNQDCNYDPKTSVCLFACSPCKCKDGYKYNSDVKACVKAEDCPKKCNGVPNAVPTDCGSFNFCNQDCNYNPKTSVCLDACSPCKCKDGYKYNSDVKACVKAEDCPKKCNGVPNAVPTKCGSFNFCNQDCNYDPKTSVCPKACSPCKCMDGYKYNSDVKACVKAEDCPKKCNGVPNAVPTDCGSFNFCNQDCNYDPKTSLCPQACSPCKCMDGYKYNSDVKACVKAEDCPKKCNGVPNAVPTKCGSFNFCNQDCNYDPKTSLCPQACSPCKCKDGYKYNSDLKACVKAEDCPKKCL